ncbi:LacI family DNA-binding transcriptional regulator [Peptoniphilus vaginalis]|uniref:LacI family DNA-binding transcriptional regulator n=1 Tax=Peptoniphilus vaginalis TaxID=1756987 RepID=UPI000A267924|nr:LacI family DNA-binding transcriptional regulator [Peptoniphilus vaginalis]
MTTLKDVAKLANVDVSTVSRALNNSGYVHPQTKKRIMDAVEELSYKPNLLIKGVKKRKKKKYLRNDTIPILIHVWRVSPTH